MNICKILDLTPALLMTSWGTIHLPEEQRIVEFAVDIRGGTWKSLRYGPCIPAPEGGFPEIRAGHERYLEAFEDLHEDFKVQMVCKEDISVGEVVRLVLGELQRSGFPYSIQKEADMLEKRIEGCRTPVRGKASRRRFEVQ